MGNLTKSSEKKTPQTIKDEKQQNWMFISQILKKYKKYYENLMKTRQLETAEKTNIECKVEKELKQITSMREAKRK